jgi:outer membrane protein TolC
MLTPPIDGWTTLPWLELDCAVWKDNVLNHRQRTMKGASGWRTRRSGISRTVVLLLFAAVTLPMALARASYRIDGKAAPQVAPNPLADELKAQLSELRNQFEARSLLFSLNQALEAGLLNNPQLAKAYAEIQGQQWSLIAVRRQWYPQITAIPGGPFLIGQNASFTSTKSTRSDKPSSSIESGTTQAGAGIQLTWTFFDPTRGPKINAAGEDVKRQQLLFDITARNLVLEIQIAYFRLQEEQLLINSFEDILAGTMRQVKLTEAQFNNGLVSIFDVEQIRSQQFSTMTNLINAYRKMIDASASLAEAMALESGALARPSEELSPLGQWDQPLQATINQALTLREEIQASLAASASANWRATALFNRYWPQFNLDGRSTYGEIQPTWGTTHYRRSWDSAVGIVFNWRVFDGGIAAAEAEAQRAAAIQASDQAAERRLEVSRGIEQSYANYATSLLALQSTQAQEQSARRAVTAVQERFAVGVADMTDVVQALSQAISAATEYTTAIRSYNSAVAELYRNSARWPEGTEPLLRQRVMTLQER